MDLFAELDESVMEYVLSISDDDSMEETEKTELIFEYLSLENDEISLQAVSEFVKSRKKSTVPIPLTPTRVALNSLVMIAQKDLPSKLAPQTETEKALIRDVLRRYEEGDDSDNEIHGLGPNENRLRISRQREEERARLKKDAEEAHDLKVSQKLKMHGDSMKDRTSRRKK